MPFQIVSGAAVAILTIGLLPAHAAAGRTFVSGHGTDGGPCTVSAPCRSFQSAYTQTAPGGEIVVLDSAGYGPVTITQSITITNPGGVEAGVTAASGGDAITINATAPANVTLRGLTLEGGGVGANGIHQTSSATGALTVIDCVVKDFTNDGILVVYGVPTNTTNPMNVTITDGYFLNNGAVGIQLTAQGGSLYQYSLTRDTAHDNATGVQIDSGGFIYGVMTDVDADNNKSAGISFPSSGYILNAIIRHSHAASYVQNASGTVPGLTVSQSYVHIQDHSAFGVTKGTSSIYSDGTNYIGAVFGSALTHESLQ